MFRNNAVLLDGRGGTFADDQRAFAADDGIFAVSLEPYAHETVRAVDYARDHGGTTVVVTDSPVSPLAKNADHVLIVGGESPSFFHSIAAAVAAAEALVVLMVAQGGRAALYTIEESGRQLGIFDAYWRRTRKISASPSGRE